MNIDVHCTCTLVSVQVVSELQSDKQCLENQLKSQQSDSAWAR